MASDPPDKLKKPTSRFREAVRGDVAGLKAAQAAATDPRTQEALKSLRDVGVESTVGAAIRSLKGLNLDQVSKVAAANESALRAKSANVRSDLNSDLGAVRVNPALLGPPIEQLILGDIRANMAELRDVAADQAANVAIQVTVAQRQSEQLDRLIVTIEQSTRVTQRLEQIALVLAAVAAVLTAIQALPIIGDIVEEIAKLMPA